jgi:hypothetical protein
MMQDMLLAALFTLKVIAVPVVREPRSGKRSVAHGASRGRPVPQLSNQPHRGETDEGVKSMSHTYSNLLSHGDALPALQYTLRPLEHDYDSRFVFG